MSESEEPTARSSDPEMPHVSCRHVETHLPLPDRLFGAKPLAPWASAAILAGVFVVLAVATWGRFGDLFLDYGVTLYGPFQVAQGLLPARDFDWLYGPFSVLAVSAWFRLWGISNQSLLVLHLLLLIVASSVMFGRLRTWFGDLAATVAMLVFFTVFAFSHSTKTGNYNYLTPYSLEALHGLYLGLAIVVVGEHVVFSGSRWAGLVAACCLAAVFLTKVEMAVAAAAAWVGCLAAAWIAWGDSRRWFRFLGMSSLLVVLLLLAVVVAALFVMPWHRAWQLLFGAWRMSMTSAATVPWNLQTMGFDAPTTHARTVALSALSVSFGLALLASLGRVAMRGPQPRFWLSLIFPVFLFLLAAALDLARWRFLVLSLPIWTLVLALWYGIQLRSPAVGRRSKMPAGQWIWSLWALGALARMVLNARVEQYGFVQAMPATILLSAFVIGELPTIAHKFRVHRRVVSTAMLWTLGLFAWVHLRHSYQHLRHRTELWTFGPVRFYTFDPRSDPRVLVYRHALGYLHEHLRDSDRLVVIPEGAFTAFSLRRLMVTRYPQLTPTEVAGFGEKEIVTDLQQKSPTVVVVVHKHTTPYLFGHDPSYGATIMKWVRANFQRERLFGDEPHSAPDRFGIEIFRCSVVGESEKR